MLDSSCSKIGETKIHSAAAYLLFYRRRSDRPLGPQYLQDIVTEARNPTQPESGEEGEEPESGEGKLGGPTSSLRGSSSALVGAGAGTNGSLRNTANGSTGAGNSLTMKQTTTSQSDGDKSSTSLGTLNGKPVMGPERPPHLQYGTQGSSWGFEALDQQHEADEGATDRLLGSLETGDVDDDADSTVANQDNDSAFEDGSDWPMHGSSSHFQDAADGFNTRGSSGFAGANTPIDDGMSMDHGTYNDYEYDDHTLYSDAHAHQDADMETLHLEDAGMTGDESGSPLAHDIYLGADEGAPTHDIYPGGDEEMEGLTQAKND